MANKKKPVGFYHGALADSRTFAHAFEIRGGAVPQVVQEHIEHLEDMAVSLKSELSGVGQVAQHYEGSQATVPADLREQELDVEAKLAALTFSGKSRDRLG